MRIVWLGMGGGIKDFRGDHLTPALCPPGADHSTVASPIAGALSRR